MNQDGIYIAYFNAEFGTSMGMFVIREGTITGADIGGGVYSGHLKMSEDQKFLEGTVGISTKEGMTTITGAVSDLPVSYETIVRLKYPVEDEDYHTIETMNGLVNVRFDKKVDL